eukprot:s2883_g11.t2
MVRRPGERVADYATRLRTVISGKKSLPDTEVGWLFKEKLMMLDALQQLLDMALQDAEAYGTIHTLATRTLRWTAWVCLPVVRGGLLWGGPTRKRLRGMIVWNVDDLLRQFGCRDVTRNEFTWCGKFFSEAPVAFTMKVYHETLREIYMLASPLTLQEQHLNVGSFQWLVVKLRFGLLGIQRVFFARGVTADGGNAPESQPDAAAVALSSLSGCYRDGKTKVGAVSTLVLLCVVVDAKDVYDKSRCDSVTPKIRQSQTSMAFTISRLPSMLRRPNTRLRWTSTEDVWADGASKEMDLSHMRSIMEAGRWPARCWDNRCRPMTRQQEYVAGQSPQKFEEEVIKPLQKQTLETYRAVYELMPVEQKEECDWMKAQDEAREDMKMFAESGNVEKLGEAINAGVTVQIEESFMLPMRQRFAQLEVALTLNTEARFTVEEHILELKRTLLAAEEANVEDADLFSRARQRLWEQEEEVRRQNERKALVALSQNGTDEERREARKILVFLEMADAVEARDLEALLRLVPEAEAAVVESHQEDEVAVGWRLIRELELAAAVKRRDLKEIRERLDAARAADVEEAKVLEASRKLALGEIKEGTKLQDAEMLLRALDEGRAAGLTENQLYTGKSAYLKMQAAAVAESTDTEDFRSVLAVAAEMGLPDHQDLVGTRRRLAQLELREAADGAGISKLQQCIQSAKEHCVDKDDIDKGTFRLCVLELQQATVDFDSERLRDAMLEAKERAAPGELFPPAKRKLASIFPEAFTEWMLVELEETLAGLDDDSSSGVLRAVLHEAAEAKVEEEDLKRAEERLAKLELREAATMSDLPEIDRILNNAQVYGWDVSQGSAGAMYEAASVRRRDLQAEDGKVDCKQNLDLAVLTLDLNMMRQYIEEAKELGLDKEVIEKAEAKYQEYA